MNLLKSDQRLALDSMLECRGVLAVEDSPLQKANLCNWLRTFGLTRVYTSGNGQDALQLIRDLQEPPCLMILDLELPGMDGIELLQHLHELRLTPALIILSSAEDVLLGAVATMAEAMNFPLLGALRKPLTPLDLFLALEKFRRPAAATTQPLDSLEPDVQQLRQALDTRAIVPHFQPKLDIQRGCLAGVEALARWQPPEGLAISPSAFIPLAEHHQLVDRLTLVMLEQILEVMGHWRRAGTPIPVAINLSASSLGDRRLTNQIIALVGHYKEDPRLITFEITESAFVMDLPAALASISRLRLKGFGFSIDDYGTGFSSMQQLSRFPFTELKIDRSFVHGAAERESLQAILQSAVDMGRRLGITTVAEGVETPEELQLLRQMGCRQAQGSGLAAPMSASALQEWLQQPLQAALKLCRT